jgi:hypothetical protein
MIHAFRRPLAVAQLRGLMAVALIFTTMALVLGIAPAPCAAQPTVERLLATAFATSGHSAFPLVVADALGEVRIPIAELADHLAHYYTFMVGALPVEFFAIWTPDSVIRTALNACDICYRAKLGYRQDGTFMVCNNCGNRFPIEKIALATGGCNPVPLTARVDGQVLVITALVLEAGLAYFPSQ